MVVCLRVMKWRLDARWRLGSAPAWSTNLNRVSGGIALHIDYMFALWNSEYTNTDRTVYKREAGHRSMCHVPGPEVQSHRPLHPPAYNAAPWCELCLFIPKIKTVGIWEGGDMRSNYNPQDWTFVPDIENLWGHELTNTGGLWGLTGTINTWYSQSPHHSPFLCKTNFLMRCHTHTQMREAWYYIFGPSYYEPCKPISPCLWLMNGFIIPVFSRMIHTNAFLCARLCSGSTCVLRCLLSVRSTPSYSAAPVFLQLLRSQKTDLLQPAAHVLIIFNDEKQPREPFLQMLLSSIILNRCSALRALWVLSNLILIQPSPHFTSSFTSSNDIRSVLHAGKTLAHKFMWYYDELKKKGI